MKRLRSSSPWLPLAGLVLAGYAFSRWRRDPQFFAGKVVVITGGSRGLGLCIARRLRKEGTSLALLARNADELEEAQRELTSAEGTGKILTVPCDVTRVEEIKAAVGAVVTGFGGIDVLINVAGIIQGGPLANMTPEDFEAGMAVHFWGNLHLTWAALPWLRRRKGARIVNVASIGGKIAIPHFAPYSASKFALVGLSHALGIELAADGIRVTTVAPGLLRTGVRTSKPRSRDNMRRSTTGMPRPPTSRGSR